MRWISKSLTAVLIGGMLLTPALAQTPKPAPMPAPMPRAPAPAPMQAPMQKPAANAPAAPMPQQRVVVVEPIRVFDPFFDYPYPYTYEPDYMAANFGFVKIDTKQKDASVFVDGGFADKVSKAKKFALRPGNHDVQLRDSDGRTIFQEKVAVTAGHTTTLHVG